MMKQAVVKGIQLFNSGKFFEAHEVLEAAWLPARGDEKLFLHGLIQIAAAFHHHTRGNTRGFHSLLEKGLKKLEKFGEVKYSIDVGRLREELQPWRQARERPGATELLQIHRCRR